MTTAIVKISAIVKRIYVLVTMKAIAWRKMVVDDRSGYQ